jgi:transcriptional regulator with XRE-family HTH domain
MMNLVYSQYLFDDFGEHLCFAQKLGLTFVFYDLYSELCKVKGVSLSRAAESMGLSRTSVVKWKAGSVPTGATLNKIAAYFGVSTDYLLGNEQKNKPSAEAESLSNIEKEILRIYANLPEEKQKAFMTVVRALESQSVFTPNLAD